MAKLHIVDGSERQPITSVSAAADHGSRRDLLVTMGARISTAVDDPNTPARDLAALTRRLMEIAKDLEQIDAKDSEVVNASSTADQKWEAV